mmetsp:Transcript_28008/g.62487  ORF Transcript_28008/g.62487 Transcript_28008/m.62487 type:complete len:241 (-) Transcript_28008:256-978(-)
MGDPAAAGKRKGPSESSPTDDDDVPKKKPSTSKPGALTLITKQKGPGKGLRQFSVRVSKMIEEKGQTTYKEVADDLVSEESDEAESKQAPVNKNIRRRVYDVLSVLVAMGIVEKKGQAVSWIGPPKGWVPTSNDQKESGSNMESERARLQGLIAQKRQNLDRLTKQRDMIEVTSKSTTCAQGASGKNAVPSSSAAEEEQQVSVSDYDENQTGLPFIASMADSDTCIDFDDLGDPEIDCIW